MAAPTITVAEHAGVCFGVQRALDLAYGAVDAPVQPVRTLGQLIHNPLVAEELLERGIGMAETVADADAGTLVIRAHGVAPAVIEEAETAGLSIIDATCPFVKRVHDAADKLVADSYQVIILGESGHPEVEGIRGHASEGALVIGSAEELSRVKLGRRVGLVVQTTQTQERLREVVDYLLPRVSEIKVYNTICAATRERQEAASELAAQCDAMIVIGGRNSGNTRRLAEICTAACANTHHIVSADELDAVWFAGCEHIGVTAGASTPAHHIEHVVAAIKKFTV